MAHIPVQPKDRGVPGWLWLLLALLAAGILAFFLLFADDDDADDVSTAGDTTRVVTPAPTPVAAALTSLDSLDAATGARSLAGRRVEVSDAEVLRAVSDSAFYVRSASGREVLVVLDEDEGVSTAGSAAGFDVAPGDRVRLRGEVREATGTMAGVPQAARSGLRAGALYVAASAADVVATTAATPPPVPLPADPGTDPEVDDPPPPPPPADGAPDTTTTTE